MKHFHSLLAVLFALSVQPALADPTNGPLQHDPMLASYGYNIDGYGNGGQVSERRNRANFAAVLWTSKAPYYRIFNKWQLTSSSPTIGERNIRNVVDDLCPRGQTCELAAWRLNSGCIALAKSEQTEKLYVADRPSGGFFSRCTPAKEAALQRCQDDGNSADQCRVIGTAKP